MKLLFNGYRTSVGMMKKFWKLIMGDDYITL